MNGWLRRCPIESTAAQPGLRSNQLPTPLNLHHTRCGGGFFMVVCHFDKRGGFGYIRY